ncbi:hypothetical protein E4695_02210 [Alcaligenaceae bacterium 429]|nr:hypothetical protein E4695_02210 [Alcaligenaceae bacterium 429]
MQGGDNELRLRAQIIRDAVVSTLDGVMPLVCKLRSDGGSDLEDMLIVQLRDTDRGEAAAILVDLVFAVSTMPDSIDEAILDTLAEKAAVPVTSVMLH